MKVDVHSATWLKIKAQAEDRLNVARLRLEGNITPEETIALRARITELKWLLALPEEERSIVEEIDVELPG